MPYFTCIDGADIYYRDCQMLFFGQQGYRVIAHDRRSHGRSTQTWDHNDYDTGLMTSPV